MTDQRHEPPEIFEAVWHPDQVAALFVDLERGADVKHVQARYGGGKARSDSAVTLGEAKRLLEQRAAQAIQIYYDFEGQSWCDTLMISPSEVRILRTRNAGGGSLFCNCEDD